MTTPCRIICSGASMSGKTFFIMRLIDNMPKFFKPVPKRVVYFYGAWQELFKQYEKQIDFIEGLPSLEKIGNTEGGVFTIVDDLFLESGIELANFFTKYSHHHNISIAFLTQQLFYQSKYSRTISLNSDILVLFKSVRDQLSISYLSQQMFPKQSSFLVDSYRKATKEAFSYILINLQPTYPDILRIQSNIFDKYPTIYSPVQVI